VKCNKTPDVRGFALKVLDVSGPAAMGGTTDHQDFLMINQDRMPGVDSREFVDFAEAAIGGPLAGILHLFKAHGPLGGFRRLREVIAMVGKKFNGFAAERFNTVAPLACGPYAVKVRLKPVGNPPPAACEMRGAAMRDWRFKGSCARAPPNPAAPPLSARNPGAPPDALPPPVGWPRRREVE